MTATTLVVLGSPRTGVAAVPEPVTTSAPAPPLAPPQDQDTVPRHALPAVSVVSRRAILSAGGASVVRTPLDSIMLAPSAHLGEALRELPFVQIRTNSRGEDQPALRGAGSRQVAVVLDGVPLTLGWDHRADLSLVPLQGAVQLDLHRGLPSLLFGPNVLGGVVEVSFSRPFGSGADGASTTAYQGVRASGRLENSGEWRLDAVGSTLLDSGNLVWQMRGGAGVHRSNGFRLPSGALESPELQGQFLVGADNLRLNSDVERTQGFGHVRVDGRSGGWAALGMTAQTTARGVPPEAHTSGPRLWREPVQDGLLLTLGGGRTIESVVGTIELTGSAGVRTGSTERESFDNVDYENPAQRQLEDGRTGTVRLAAQARTNRGVLLRSAVTGADIVHTEGAPGEPGERYRQRLWSVGAEAEVPFDGGPGGRTNVSGGVVIEGTDTPDAGPREASPGIATWGARAGLSTLLNEAGTLTGHWSMSRRARFPSLRERYSGALGRFLTNPDLKAEVQLSTEGGVTAALGRGELQGVLFFQRTRDGIARASIERDGELLLQRVNRGQVRALGAEFLATLETSATSIEADLTIQRTRVTTGSESLVPEYEPGWRGSLMARTTPGRLMGPGTLPSIVEAVGIRGSVALEGVQSCLDPAPVPSKSSPRTIGLRSVSTCPSGRPGRAAAGSRWAPGSTTFPTACPTTSVDFLDPDAPSTSASASGNPHAQPGRSPPCGTRSW
jgi:iron complex outermembrane recepter protein